MGLGDLGDLADKGLGKLEEGVEWGKHKVGEGVDWGTEKVGAGLDRVGASRVGDAFEAWGDKQASSLGVDIPEKQLGQSEDPKELIHGDAAKIRGSTKHLTDFKGAFDRVGDGMKQLDSSRWRGEAAEAFRAKFAMHPKDWLHAADACGEAAAALERYADAVLWAQGQAREAMIRYNSGKEASASAVAAYNKRVDTYNAAIKAATEPGPKPEPFKDPGVAEQENAQEFLKAARRQRDDAGEAAKKAVAAALAHAPAEPPATSRALANAADAGMALNIESAHAGAGVIKGTAGLLNFVRAVSPMEVYNLTHPAEYQKNLNLTLNGLASSAAHPDRTLKNTWETLKADPSEFGGRLIPEIAGPKGLGFGRGLVSKLPDKPPAPGRHGPGTHPNEPAIECSAKRCEVDPIDVATGRMLLPQTDVVLPGSLPLSFERIFESSYRAGRWFGPAWASTADQRLEIDSQGVIFAREDGSLLAYPHPAPGVPAMPTHGQRWPLDRELSGYTVTNPASGQVWHFADHGDDQALLKQIDDRNGRWIAYEHDAAGAPTGIVHHSGYHLKLTTDQDRITALHLAGAAADGTDQEILRYGYTEGHLTEVTNSSGIPLRFGYDELGRITSWTDTNGSHFDYVYDEHHRCTSQSGSNGHLNSRLTYDTDPESSLRATAITDSLGHTTRFLVNEAVQVVAEIDPAGAVTRFERDSYNRLLSVTDPLGQTGRTTYNASGLPMSVTRPDGRQAASVYDDQGLPVRVTSPNGTVVRQVYDDRGNRVSVTDPSSATTRFAYDEAGHVTSVTDALGHSTGVRCDKAGLPLEVTDPLGARTCYVRDAFGRVTTITNPLRATTCLEWTVEGKLARRTEPDGSQETWTYDGEGNCVAHRCHGRGHPLRIHRLRPARRAHWTGRRAVRVHPQHQSATDTGHQPTGPDLELQLRRDWSPGL
ncbi:putative T7SS-secreted protein [Streptomyces sp. 21So2-11]|uniref:putative T7SS-secreted protein n=1 Tax=Streptomyces sp. 21So2-11 TaxID=3144408 RepID=UPI003218E040